jgi:DNA-binding beta-propeller fold protein YncE
MTMGKLAWVCMLAALACTATVGEADTLLVVRKSADALDFVDPGSGVTLASVAVGFAPHEVAVAPDGKHAAVSNYGTREKAGSTLSIVDLERPREVRRIDLAPHTRPHGVDWYAADRVAVTTEGSRHLLIVDPWRGEMLQAFETAQEVSHMVAVAPDRNRAYVASIGSGSVTATSLAASAPKSAVRTVETGAGTEAIAVRPDGREVWVAARAAGTLVRLDAGSLEKLGQVDLPGVPIRIAFSPDGHTAFVSCAGSAEVVAFDAMSGRELRRRKVEVPLAEGAAARPFAGLAAGSPLPVGLLVSPDSRSVYVAATMADRIVQFDARTLEVLRVIEVAGEPDGLGITPVMPKAECHACTPENGDTPN